MVDELKDPISLIPDIMSKLEKAEILRHYRIANYTDINNMLELIAQKKGLVEKQKQEVNPSDLKKKVKKVFVANKVDAAKRVIRDFLNNRLRYYTKLWMNELT